MEPLRDILDVAGGNKPLSVTIEPLSIILVGLAVFGGMVAALVLVKSVFK
jgi:hypothetical protein